MRVKKSHFVNMALAVVSTLAAYIVLEWLVYPALLPNLPLRLHQYTGDLYVLAQSSKAGTVPKDYIAVVGDSYAKGNGDWLLEADPSGNGPFHSLHVLNELSGRDVLTFGTTNTGSLKGMVTSPLSQFSAVQGSPWYALDPPQQIVVYVYEGNDFTDNIRDLRRLRRRGENPAASPDAAAIEAFVARQARQAANASPARAPVLSFAGNAIAGGYQTVAEMLGLREPPSNKWAELPTGDGAPPPPPTVALIGGERQTLPAYLQSASLELTEAELDLAIQVMRVSMAAMRDAWPRADLAVVYIPSPLSAYDLQSTTVSTQSYLKRETIFPTAVAMRRSDRLCRATGEVAAALGAAFFDARPAIRAVAGQRLIHGPRDWKHFNRAGHTALGRAVNGLLADGPSDGGRCATLPVPPLAG